MNSSSLLLFLSNDQVMFALNGHFISHIDFHINDINHVFVPVAIDLGHCPSLAVKINKTTHDKGLRALRAKMAPFGIGLPFYIL